MITYTEGYDYQLEIPVTYQTTFRPQEGLIYKFITLETDGRLIIDNGYAWDGSSGGIDRGNMRGSLIHDSLCDLVNEGLLKKSDQEQVDWILKEVCLADGMSSIRAWWIHRAVRRFDKLGLKRYKKKEVLTA